MNNRLKEKDGRFTPVLYKGDKFNSLKDLADHLELNPSQISRILSEHERSEFVGKEISHFIEAFFKGKFSYFVFKRGFNTFSELAKHTGLKENVLSGTFYSLKPNQRYEDEILRKMKKEPIIFNGNEYERMSDLCMKYKQDYNVFIERVKNGMSLKDALEKEIRACQRASINFKGNDFKSIRELYNYYGLSRSFEASLKSNYPNIEPLKSLELFLDYLEYKGLDYPTEFLTAIPMVFYNGDYYVQAKSFYKVIGVTVRNVTQEKFSKENEGLSLEEIVLNMGRRTYSHNKERIFPNAGIEKKDILIFVKKDFERYVQILFEDR